jgi:hypothetical protein
MVNGATDMPGFLLHVFRRGSQPLRTLSALPDEEALRIMRGLYREGSTFWERFQDPAGYLGFRRQVEAAIRNAFIAKGGKPVDAHPVYLVVGRPRWMETAADRVTLETTEMIEVPLSAVTAECVSFTYPDSMVSMLLAAEKDPRWYEPDLHGRVFCLDEIRQIIAGRGLPGEGWQTRMPARYAHYVEAQVWDREALAARLPGHSTGPSPRGGSAEGGS